MNRTRISNSRSRGLFKNTARRTKRVNVAPNVSRGGIRL